MQIDTKQIKSWMDEKYNFWRTSFPYYFNKETIFWQIHPKAELQKRLQHLRILSKHVKHPSSTTIVDVGIAGGMWPYLLHKIGFNAIGIDWGDTSSQNELEKLHPGIKVYALYYDKRKWPIQDNSVDIVTFLDTIEHVHPPRDLYLLKLRES